MLRNDSYWFSRLGLYIERADNTARILDVKYNILLPESETIGGSLDYFQWASIPARCLGAQCLSLGLSHQSQALAYRRSADPADGDAALAHRLLRQYCPLP